MEDETSRLVNKVQELGDIELAALLCLIAQEHCIIEADDDDLDNVAQELGLIANNTFELSYAVINCSKDTSVDDFGRGILIEDEDDAVITSVLRLPNFRHAEDSFFSSDANAHRRSAQSPADLPQNTRIADVVIAKNLNLTSNQVQIQALELLRNQRIFTRTALHVAPKRFLFIALLSTGHDQRLINHLNDFFAISHSHEIEDEFDGQVIRDDNSSTGSVIRSPPATPGLAGERCICTSKTAITKKDIDHLISLYSAVRLSSDVRAYLHDVVVFTRMHRAVASGVSALATRHLYSLVRALAPLHGMDYITPSLVALAARKIYPHRLVITTPENERSTQWGSSVEAVAELLDGITIEEIIEDVLETVQVPL